jgi:hypothetical protein
MRSRGIIATIIVFVSIPFIFTCSEEKTASIEGHEDIVAVLHVMKTLKPSWKFMQRMRY